MNLPYPNTHWECWIIRCIVRRCLEQSVLDIFCVDAGKDVSAVAHPDPPHRQRYVFTPNTAFRLMHVRERKLAVHPISIDCSGD